MRTWYFSEMAYHPAWEKGLARGSLRVNFPSEHLDPEVATLLVRGAAPSTADQVRDRALRAVADEIRRMLDEGVVAEADDIDLCLLLGAGWPFHLGGITPYLDRSGVAEQSIGHRFHPPGVASLPE